MASEAVSDQQYRLEVMELTDLLRNDPDWEEQRSFLAGQNLNHAELVVASFYEGEGGEEYGVVVTCSHEVFEYSRHKARIESWSNITGSAEAVDEYPQIPVALELVVLLC